MIAVGTMDSYIRVWSMDGSPLVSILLEKNRAPNNRMLIGHSGPVMGMSFSDAVTWPEYRDTNPLNRSPRLLLSASADGTVRLWNLETWCCMTVYKGHSGPVWKVLWGPYGHYFATACRDGVVRVYTQDHITSRRDGVGHDSSISAIAWHPNGTYVFSASDHVDRSIRMWSVATGECVRVLTGHLDDISALACAPNGKLLVSADWSGKIFYWDLEKGQVIKKSRGHGKGGIMSLSFSAESTALVSGALDGTVRIWDVALPADGSKAADTVGTGGQILQPTNTNHIGSDTITVGGQPQQPPPTAGASSSGAAGASANPGSSGPGGGKKKGKEAQITADQLSAFPTKKTPLKKVMFTRMNLVIASGCYDPAL